MKLELPGAVIILVIKYQKSKLASTKKNIEFAIGEPSASSKEQGILKLRLPRRFAPRKDRGEIVYNMWKNNFLKPL